MKGRMNKKDLDCMVRDADTDNDGFINCKGWRTKKLNISIRSLLLLPQSFACSSVLTWLKLRRNVLRKES